MTYGFSYYVPWTYYDTLKADREARLMARKKRPPLVGDIHKCMGIKVLVFLNQKLVENVIEYNCETGYILKEKLDKKGLPIIENDAIATEELYGSVLVKRID